MNHLLKVIDRRHRPIPWNPAQLPDLRGWWVPGYLGQANGTPVTSLLSMAGPANSLDSPDGARSPLYATVNGKGALSMDGTDDVMYMSDKTVSDGATALTYFALIKMDSIPVDASALIIIGISGSMFSSTRAMLALRNTAGALKAWTVYVKNAESSATTTIPSATNADLNTHVVIASLNRDPAGMLHTEIWLDGTNILTDDRAFSEPTWPVTESVGGYVGCRDVTNRGMVGKMLNFGVRRAAPSTQDRQRMEGYLAWYGGIQGQLPGGHPYLAGPPVIT